MTKVTHDESHRDDSQHASDQDDEELPSIPEAIGEAIGHATAARIESIEKAMSAIVIEVTVPQKPRSHRREPGPGCRLPARLRLRAEKKWEIAR